MSSFQREIRADVDRELRLAQQATLAGDATRAFAHLERAHVLGQGATALHVLVHWRMFRWGLARADLRECAGQVLRLVGAATKTAIGLVPTGNTGGTQISPFARLPVPPELAQKIAAAHQRASSHP
jgi:Protein of unknown function (DUF3703)